MKILPVGAEFLADGRTTDMAKLIVAFHSFANAAKTAKRGFQKCAKSLKQHLCLGRRDF